MFVMPAGRNQQLPVLQRKHPHRQGIDDLQPLMRQEIGFIPSTKARLVAVDLVLQLVSGVAGTWVFMSSGYISDNISTFMNKAPCIGKDRLGTYPARQKRGAVKAGGVQRRFRIAQARNSATQRRHISLLNHTAAAFVQRLRTPARCGTPQRGYHRPGPPDSPWACCPPGWDWPDNRQRCTRRPAQRCPACA